MSEAMMTPEQAIALSDRLKQDRLNRRMSWPRYAKWMDIKQSTLYKIAMGSTTRPHALTLQQISLKLAEPIGPKGASVEMVPSR